MGALIGLVVGHSVSRCWWPFGESSVQFHLSDPVIMTLIGSSTASVIGVFLIVLHWLFPMEMRRMTRRKRRLKATNNCSPSSSKFPPPRKMRGFFMFSRSRNGCHYSPIRKSSFVLHHKLSSPCSRAFCTGSASERARMISEACQRASAISSMRYLRPEGPPGFQATRM